MNDPVFVSVDAAIDSLEDTAARGASSHYEHIRTYLAAKAIREYINRLEK